MYGPSGTWRRKPSLFKRCARNAYHSLRSAPVIVRRKPFTRRFLASEITAWGMGSHRTAQTPSKRGDSERREAVMLEPAEIAREEGAQIRHAVFQHGDAVDAEAEGEALIAFGIEPHIAQHVGMHHAAAENLEPLIALANADLVTHFGVADIDFHRRLGEREIARAEAHFHLWHLEEGFAELLQHPFQVAEMGLLVDHQSLDLMEHRRVGLVRIAAIDPARRDDAQGGFLFQHGADLHWARMGAQQRPRSVGAWREIERIVVLARGVLGRNIES